MGNHLATFAATVALGQAVVDNPPFTGVHQVLCPMEAYPETYPVEIWNNGVAVMGIKLGRVDRVKPVRYVLSETARFEAEDLGKIQNDEGLMEVVKDMLDDHDTNRLGYTIGRVDVGKKEDGHLGIIVNNWYMKWTVPASDNDPCTRDYGITVCKEFLLATGFETAESEALLREFVFFLHRKIESSKNLNSSADVELELPTVPTLS